MRISDIDIMRSDTPDVSVSYDDGGLGCTLELTAQEKDLLSEILKERRRLVGHTLKQNTSATKRIKWEAQKRMIEDLQERLR